MSKIILYSDDLKKWIPARPYQCTALKLAIKHYKKTDSTYKYKDNDIVFKLKHHSSNIYRMIKDDDTFAYLKLKNQEINEINEKNEKKEKKEKNKKKCKTNSDE